jgi:hypothetical protein
MGKAETDTLRLIALAALLWSGSALAEPQIVTWADLRADRQETCAAFLDNYLAHPNCSEQIALTRLLSRRFEMCTPGDTSLDGRVIRIAGYVHPLEFEFKNVRQFLLIPPLRRDCRHPPPPLPDQVISVEYPDGIDVTADPVWVTGELRVQHAKNDIAPASYTLKARAVVDAIIPDVTDGESP